MVCEVLIVGQLSSCVYAKKDDSELILIFSS